MQRHKSDKTAIWGQLLATEMRQGSKGLADPQVITDDGVRLHVQLEGREDGPPLLLCNGLGTDLSMWDEQIPTLGKTFQIARYDTRGHGGSDAPGGDYSIERLGRDALAVADGLGWETFNFCGLSLGAMTGLWIAIHAPERLIRLVAANGAPYAGGPQPWTDRMAQIAASGVERAAAGAVARWFTPSFAAAHPERMARLAASFRGTSLAGYLGCSAAIRDMDQRPGLGKIVAPTLLIGGTHDTSPFPAVIEGLAATIPNARVVILETAHLSNVADPAGFNHPVAEFLG